MLNAGNGDNDRLSNLISGPVSNNSLSAFKTFNNSQMHCSKSY